MASGRMLSSRISTDARVQKLPCATARLLFSWMIAHADNCGRLRGDAAYVRVTVLPHEPGVADADVEAWLVEMADLGLIDRYHVDGGTFISLRAWDKHQRLDRMKRSDYPAPPGRQSLPTDREPVVTDREPVVAGSEVKGSEENGSKDRAENPARIVSELASGKDFNRAAPSTPLMDRVKNAIARLSAEDQKRLAAFAPWLANRCGITDPDLLMRFIGHAVGHLHEIKGPVFAYYAKDGPAWNTIVGNFRADQQERESRHWCDQDRAWLDVLKNGGTP